MKKLVVEDGLYTETMLVKVDAREIKLVGTEVSKKGFIVDLSVRRATDTTFVTNGAKIINDTVFDSAVLKLKKGQSEIIFDGTPLSTLDRERFKNTAQNGYPINKTGINFSEATLKINCDDSFIDKVNPEFVEFTYSFYPEGHFILTK